MKDIFRKFLCAVAVGVSCVLAANATVHRVTITPYTRLNSQQLNSVAVGQSLNIGNGVRAYIFGIEDNRRYGIQRIHIAYFDGIPNCPWYLKGCYKCDVSIQMGTTSITAGWLDLGQPFALVDWWRMLDRQSKFRPVVSSAIPTVQFDPDGQFFEPFRNLERMLRL